MLSGVSAFASYVFTDTLPGGGWDVPDGSIEGISRTIHVSQAGILPLAEVRVNLNISGGFNGDLYAYLTHGETSFAVLLNRVGRVAGNEYGSPDGGMNVTLVGSLSAADIHFASARPPGGLLSGTFQADGREVDPELALGDYVTSPDYLKKTALLSDFAGHGNPSDGDWELFIADVSGGGVSTLVGWGVELSTVPEPSIAGLAFGLVSLGSFGGYKLRQRLAAKKA